MINRRNFMKGLVGLIILGETTEGFSEQYKDKKRVVVCFDTGVRTPEKWEELTQFSNELANKTGAPAPFSFYITSCDFFTHLSGGSDTGFAKSKENAERNVKIIQGMINNGHEIGSHSVRHKNGEKWNYNQWHQEIKEFDEHISRFFSDKTGKSYKCIGFRAPYLGYNDNMHKALSDLKYTYDISKPGDFVKNKDGLTLVGLPEYKRKNGKIVLGMDYNWHVLKISDVELESILEKELERYDPLIISMHNSRWQHGARCYWDTVKDFLRRHAQNEDIKIISMGEYVGSIRDKTL
ncbi:MAG: polysaccharide deacetylase family protein [Candidatus Pacearchaeota archaeon]